MSGARVAIMCTDAGQHKRTFIAAFEGQQAPGGLWYFVELPNERRGTRGKASRPDDVVVMRSQGKSLLDESWSQAEAAGHYQGFVCPRCLRKFQPRVHGFSAKLGRLVELGHDILDVSLPDSSGKNC